ncbi:PREDICTED: androglobin-like isoform X2 [Wasmannia auropunctata]|uniref:androglobin-like isoform X2 n=1 Tax=Wasmannia auropunctata TaxID=64793 RepID=UPI0005F00A7D|nr:PREDICTED: androglobin-like isoform X2 [Wasmannia auropunctata]
MSESIFTAEINRRSDTNVAFALWPEWKDFDLNNEKWGIKNGPDGLFVDAERVAIPRSLEPDLEHWIRAKDLKHLTASPTVYTTTMEYPDLITNNKHLLHSEFVRWFLSALVNLQYCGREGLDISGEDSNFAWTGYRNPWYGWMHVYSMNKAGKDTQHRPVTNPNGKYIVRLHYMGCWRRILVDDVIPVDKNGRPLLPCTSNNFELWPMLLAKALLKIASLTWTERREIIDFHPIACLTGWTCLIINVAHLTLQDKWDLLTKYSEHFEWTPRTAHDYIPESSANARKPGETQQLLAAAETERPQPTALFLLLSDTRALGSDVVPGLSPCWDHVIYVIQSRDVPIDPKDVKPLLPKWKFHRWLKWAVSRNVIDPADYFVPIRYLRVISPLEECNSSVVRDKNYVAGNSISSNEIERSDKFIRRRMRSQRTSDLPTMSKEEATENVNRWIDFNKMASYVTEMHLFYKLEHFQYSSQVTSDVLKIANESYKAEAAKVASKETGKEKDIYNSGKILKSRYKPLYLFCDSPKKKFFLFNLCTAPKHKNSNLHEKDYLIVEKYNWFFISEPSNQSIIISTTGNKSTIVELKAGRQLLRIHSHSDFGLTTISSDTNFHLGDCATVQQLMTTESDRIEQISKVISDNLCKAYRSFGTRDYPAMLKNLYRSYVPNLQFASSKQNKNFRTLIHRFFMEEQIKLIKKTVPDEELKDILHSLRVFFLNPHIRSEYLDLMTNQKILRNLTKETSKMWSSTSSNRKEVFTYDQAATTIQSFFRMSLVKGYKQLHSPDHALHTQIRERLQKISDLFDPSVASRLLRNLINRHNGLRNLYPCSEDFIHVLNIQEFRGVLENIRHEQWFPIVRIVVNPKPDAVLAAFELLINLPRFALRVFNNQNGREMTRLVNCVMPGHYKYLPDGYTVFAYGWSDKQHFKELDWTFRVITVKGDSMFYQVDEQRPLSLETKPPKLMVDELVGTYIPNVRNCISRCILRVPLKRSIVSIRLTTSYSLAKIRIKVIDEDGNILIDVNGGSTVLLPFVILKHAAENDEDYRTENNSRDIGKEIKNAEKKNLYYIEAFVLNNSWPLTDVEWTVASQAKMKSAGDIKTTIQSGNRTSLRSSLPTMRKDVKQVISNDQTLKSPYWILQVVTDARDAVEICQDTSRESEIILLKESWWSKDPNRSVRGKNLREAFLNAYASKIESDVSLNQTGTQLRLIEDKDMEFCLSYARQYRTLKPSEFHYDLPALDLTKYMKRDKNAKDQRIKTKNDDEILKDQHTAIIVDSQTNYFDYLKNLAELMNKQLRRYLKHFGKKEKNFWQRRTFVDAVYEMRKIYIDSLILEKVKNKANKGKKD